MEAIPRYDTLDLYETNLQVRQVLDDETIFYSLPLQKFNRYGWTQDRVWILTNKHFFVLEPTATNYRLHR